MNPFDLRGPEFLGFYVALMGLVLLCAYLYRRSVEHGELPRIDLSNPYLLACLQGGRKAVFDVLVFSLIDRGLLLTSGREIQAVEGAKERVRRPEEQALLEACAHGTTLDALRSAGLITWVGAEEEAQLRKLGLLPDGGQVSHRMVMLAMVLIVLLGVALAKILIALGRGHTNLGFLVALGVLATYLSVKVILPMRTALGSRVLKDVQSLFQDAKHRAAHAHPGNGNFESLMVAAVFGVAASYPFLLPFQPSPSASSSSSCGSSCGGGCGGGCGGCGS